MGVVSLLILLILAVVGYFFFIRVKMDPNIAELADFAYAFTCEYLGYKNNGKTPPVILVDAPWMRKNQMIRGSYKGYVYFGIILYEKVIIVRKPSRIFPDLCHEFAHCLEKREGDDFGEKYTEKVESYAYTIKNNPKLNELLMNL